MTVIYKASNESNERLSRQDPAQNPWGNAKNVLKIIGCRYLHLSFHKRKHEQ